MANTIKYSEKKKEYNKKWAKENPEKRRLIEKRYRENHPEKVGVWNKRGSEKYRLKLKIETLSHYSDGELKCACCGEKHFDFLTIDHINGGGMEDRKKHGSGYAFYYWLRRNGFPEGFQVLCMNCNFGRALNNGTCPHKSICVEGIINVMEGIK